MTKLLATLTLVLSLAACSSLPSSPAPSSSHRPMLCQDPTGGGRAPRPTSGVVCTEVR